MKDFEVVTKDWLEEKLRKYHLKNYELAEKIGIDFHNISKFVNGKREMSSQTQAVLYYYFAFLDLEKELKK